MTGTTITLRGIEVELTSDLGRAFTISACQAAEGLIEDSELAEAYELTPKICRSSRPTKPLDAL
jgi:hypothetical protein